MKQKKKIVVGISGASGSIYAIRLLKVLLLKPVCLYIIISKMGLKVLEYETGYKAFSEKGFFEKGSFESFLKKHNIVLHKNACIKTYTDDDFFAPPASGSFKHDGMVIVPCSMKTLGSIAAGISDNLMSRAADVTLKEKRPLILLTRETPLNPIHLKNMYQLSISGATIMPASPGFYMKPKNINDMVDGVIIKIADFLKIEHNIMSQWGDSADIS